MQRLYNITTQSDVNFKHQGRITFITTRELFRRLKEQRQRHSEATFLDSKSAKKQGQQEEFDDTMRYCQLNFAFRKDE